MLLRRKLTYLARSPITLNRARPYASGQVHPRGPRRLCSRPPVALLSSPSLSQKCQSPSCRFPATVAGRAAGPHGAEDDRGRLLVGECKWTRAPVERDALAQFQSRAANHPLLAKRQTQLSYFSKAGFIQGAIRFALDAGIQLISLRDMLAH